MNNYEKRIEKLESEGLSTSDAQAVIEVEDRKKEREMRITYEGAKKGIQILHPENLEELMAYGIENLGWKDTKSLKNSLVDLRLDSLCRGGKCELENSRVHIDFGSTDEFK